MNKAEKIWSMDSEKMRIFLLREIEETGSEWEALIKQHINGCQKGKANWRPSSTYNRRISKFCTTLHKLFLDY